MKAGHSLEQLQQVVTHLNTTLNHPLQQANWRLQQRELERTAAGEQISQLRTENRDALTAALDKVFNYKEQCEAQSKLLLAIAAGEAA